jgi:hypothetical protein
MGWHEFLAKYAETLGVSALFAALSSGMLLWIGSEPITKGRALLIVAAGQFVASIATAFVHGYLNWNIFVAPAVGATCGLVALPAIISVVKAGKTVEGHAGDIAEKAIDKVTK